MEPMMHLPTTDRIAQECPRYRILVVGRSGTGKTALINAIFKTSLADVKDNRPDISRGITSEHNKSLILHDSQGYDGNEKGFEILKDFVHERCHKEHVSERIHAIWLCVPVPSAGDPLFQRGDEKIFQLDRNNVPLIVVFTKSDLFEVSVRSKFSPEPPMEQFMDKYGWIIKESLKNMSSQISFTLVSTSHPETLQKLVRLTMQRMHTDTRTPSNSQSLRAKNHFSSGVSQGNQPTDLCKDLLNSAQITPAVAQRVDLEANLIDASIRVGKKKYWRAIASSVFVGVNFQNCLSVMHKDIVAVWNIQGLKQYFLSNAFRSLMMLIVNDLSDYNANSIGVMKTSQAKCLNWTNHVCKGLPENIRCLMGYVVNLTLIIQAAFRLSLDDVDRKVRVDHVKEIIYELYCSEKKKKIHSAIRAFVNLPLAKNSVVDKIESLLLEYRLTEKDMHFNYNRPPLESLFPILRMEPSVFGESKINRISLSLLCKLLDFPDYAAITSALADIRDAEVLLDFILKVLRNGFLSNSGIKDANRKARKLMLRLIAHGDVTPTSLFISDIKIPDDVGPTGLGQVFKGAYRGSQVTLKVLHHFRHKNDPVRKDICREVLVWQSLSHRYVLPLLGIFEDRSRLTLVSPYMKGGTLTQWRKTQQPTVRDIQKRMLEVAEGIRHIHSEGIIHGALCGANVFLDSGCHCQITDFGLIWHADTTATRTTTELTINFAAPELFGPCSDCDQEESDGCDGDDRKWRRNKTLKTDVYAFGCLYYTIFYGALPYKNKTEHQIIKLVTNGMLPNRPESPKMADGEWDLIRSCWAFKPLERPTMEQVVETMTSLAPSF